MNNSSPSSHSGGSKESVGDPSADPHERKSHRSGGVHALLGGLFGLLGKGNSGSKSTTINTLIEHHERNGNGIGGGESEMIHNILKAAELEADDVMLPRADMVCLPVTMSAEEVVEAITQTRHTRYAIYGEDKDDILGMLHIKDVLLWLSEHQSKNGSKNGNDSQQFILKDNLRPVMFVSPSMRAMDLLLRMRAGGQHLAMVVDEHGGIDGQISLEDLVEEVIGDIRDEMDGNDEPNLLSLPDGGYLIDGRYDLQELQQQINGFDFSESGNGEFDLEDIDTIGGLVMAVAGRVPLVGEIIRHAPSGWEFHVTSADPRHIRRLRLYRKPVAGDAAAKDA